ncbi:class I SAM-dependent methyltransferase [Phytomonospora sp. NPDC050363]|uniref:class I SAM-dependent methyltransferase n=1 Tax=Phytomonospora sp. NPDC050363 TaxID=3155642 RepID=UPI0033C701C6
MRTNYTEAFRDDRELGAPRTFSAHVGARQREWLRAFTEAAFAWPPVHHDFACGTGRVLRMLDGLTSAAHGYDISEAKLAEAREIGVPADLHVVRATGPLPSTMDIDVPALVTVFRLLLDAPPELRERAMEFAAGMLPTSDSGLLVVENHGNASSLRGIGRSAGGVEDGAGLSHDEVGELFDRWGFELLTRQGFSLLTQGFYRVAPVRWLVPGLDSWASRRSFLAGRATDLLYVARRRH